jgi:EmrB/QacA subfamily drug resistance transporter
MRTTPENPRPTRSLIERIRGTRYHRWLVVCAVGFGIITGGIDNSMMNVAMPRLAVAFGVEADVILWLTASFMLVAVGLALTWGSLGDSIGRRRIFMMGFVLFTIGMAAMAASQNMPQAIGARVIQAVGQSMVVTNGFAISMAAFPIRDRGKVIGITGAFVGIGLTIGPLFAGFMLERFEWQALFYTRLPLGLIALAVVAVVIPGQRPTGERKPFDYGGAVTLFITLSTLLLAINRAPRMGLESPLIVGLIAASAVAGTLFFLFERKAPAPVVNLSLFKNRYLTISLAVHFTHFFGYMFLIFVLPFFLLAGRGLSTLQVGVFAAVIQVVRLVSAPASGWATDRFGSRAVATVGILGTTIGLGFLSTLGTESSFLEIGWALALTGIGAAVFDPANESAVLKSVPEDRLGATTALTATARQVGFSLGTAVAGTFYAARLRTHELGLGEADAAHGAYGEVMLAAVAIMAVGAALSILRGKERATDEPVELQRINRDTPDTSVDAKGERTLRVISGAFTRSSATVAPARLLP